MSGSPNPFTPVEDRLMREYLAQGDKPSAIAKKMGRAESSIYRRIQTLGLGAGQTAKTRRPCMCCQKEFLSDGPHNRLCTTCRRIDTSNPYQP